MPLFKVGDFGQIGVSFVPTARVTKAEHKDEISFPRTLSVDALSELSFNTEPPAVDLARSPNRWGLYLKSLSLHKSFEGFIANLFNPTNEIYFTSITWDYSGTPPLVYPRKGAKDSKFLIPMRAKETRQFAFDGVSLWPARIVVGALNLVVLVYECDKDVRELGERLVGIHDAVGNSNLAGLVTAISANPSLATEAAIAKAVEELLGVVGRMMKRERDDYVDLFEGSYGTDKSQTARVDKYDQEATGIELDFRVS